MISIICTSYLQLIELCRIPPENILLLLIGETALADVAGQCALAGKEGLLGAGDFYRVLDPVVNIHRRKRPLSIVAQPSGTQIRILKTLRQAQQLTVKVSAAVGEDNLELRVLLQHRRKLVGEADAVILCGLGLARLIGGSCAERHDAGMKQQRDIQIKARLIQEIKRGIVNDVILYIGVHFDAPKNALGSIAAQICQ